MKSKRNRAVYDTEVMRSLDIACVLLYNIVHKIPISILVNYA
jgi:hypothetical protein